MKNSQFTDNEILEIASSFKKHLKSNISTIKNVYPDFDQNFIFKFKALYYEVHRHQSDTGQDKITQSFLAELSDLADKVRILIPIFRFYMQKAFPYESNLWEAYGYCELETVVREYYSLRKCLEGAVKMITEKRAELRAAKCPDSTLNEIISIAKQVATKHQEWMDHLEKKETERKANKMRLKELYQLMQIVNDAASKSLQNDPESLKYLTFPPKEQVH